MRAPLKARIRYVLDSSAMLAVLQLEPGGDVVADAIENAVMSAVNVSEVVGALSRKGMPVSEAVRAMRIFQLQIEPFDEFAGYAAAALLKPTSPYGLSLGDRACLALGQRLSFPIMTGDKVWAKLDLGIELKMIR
jgi:ribonuclease VapC